MTPEPQRPLKVFLCHIMPVGYTHADTPVGALCRDPVPQGDDMRGLYARLTQDGVDRYAWLDKAKLHGERSAVLSLSKRRTILPGQGFDRLNLPDWELEIRKAVRKSIIHA